VVIKLIDVFGQDSIGCTKTSFNKSLPELDYQVNKDDLALLANLVKRGDSHAKPTRGIHAVVNLHEVTPDFLIELDTYRHGRTVVMSSSAMHSKELLRLTGQELKKEKIARLATTKYDRREQYSYQCLKHIYEDRRWHRHPDWQTFCNFIETLPFAGKLICRTRYRYNGREYWDLGDILNINSRVPMHLLQRQDGVKHYVTRQELDNFFEVVWKS
jgi:uncharacterized protein YozE (UPF0346 family)